MLGGLRGPQSLIPLKKREIKTKFSREKEGLSSFGQDVFLSTIALQNIQAIIEVKDYTSI